MGTYVLIHGAFTGGWIWKHVATRLRAAGHDVYTPTLDGCAARRHQFRPEITMATNVREMIDYLFYQDLKEVVLVGTSVSGVTISKIADAAPERIKRLVYIDAILLLPGEKGTDVLDPDPQSVWDRTEIGRKPDRNYLKNSMLSDVDPEIRDWAVERFTLWPFGASLPEGEAMDFWNKSWPATVINCLHSRNPAGSHQRRNAEKLNATFIEMDSGHYPMLSKPEELARLIMTEQ